MPYSRTIYSELLCSLYAGCANKICLLLDYRLRLYVFALLLRSSTPVPSTTKLCKLLKFNTCRVFLFVKISKMVTLGHHSANR